MRDLSLSALRELVDARNELDAVAYQVQRSLDEAGGAVAEHDRARAEMLVSDARTAVEQETSIDRLRALTGELHQMAQALALSASSGPPPAGADESSPSSSADVADDDVIDAEFTAH